MQVAMLSENTSGDGKATHWSLTQFNANKDSVADWGPRSATCQFRVVCYMQTMAPDPTSYPFLHLKDRTQCGYCYRHVYILCQLHRYLLQKALIASLASSQSGRPLLGVLVPC